MGDNCQTCGHGEGNHDRYVNRSGLRPCLLRDAEMNPCACTGFVPVAAPDDRCTAPMGEGFGICGAPLPCGMHRPVAAREAAPDDTAHRHKWMWLEVSGESFLQCACGETFYPDEVEVAEWPGDNPAAPDAERGRLAGKRVRPKTDASFGGLDVRTPPPAPAREAAQAEVTLTDDEWEQLVEAAVSETLGDVDPPRGGELELTVESIITARLAGRGHRE